jgi:flagellar biosynthesis protein FlhB
MAQQAGERTEKATSRRRQRARDQGQFAYSQELTSAMTLAACGATVFYYLQSPSGFRAFFASLLENAATQSGPQLVRQSGTYFLIVAAPIFAAAVIAALAGNFIQGLPIFPRESSAFKWERLNPVQGLSRLKTQISWMQWLKLCLLAGVVGLVVWKTLTASWEQLITLPAYSIESSNSIIRSLTLRIFVYITGAVGILAIGDFFIQRWRFEQNIKQTKAEVKEDMKALEGNPTIKGKIRSIQRDSARRRMMLRVKDADVIVTNPTHYAVALEYKPDKMAAPRVVAKGRNWLAQKIKELGREHDIPTVENVPLARALYRSVDIEQEIPMELYKAVAEVLAYVYKIRKRT